MEVVGVGCGHEVEGCFIVVGEIGDECPQGSLVQIVGW